METIIIVMLVVMAFLFAGGNFNGFDSTITSSTPAPTAPSTSTSPGAASPTPIPWSISIAFLGCNINGSPKADINSTGSDNGYINLEISDTNGGFREIATANFLSPGSRNTATLLNSDGFNAKTWRVNLYSGGSFTNDKWSGGILKATANGAPTGC